MINFRILYPDGTFKNISSDSLKDELDKLCFGLDDKHVLTEKIIARITGGV